MRIILLFILISMCSVMVYSKTDTLESTQADSLKELKHVEFIGAVGTQLTRYSQPPTQQSTTTDYAGSSYTGRILWRGGHLIGIGLLSGYVIFSGESFELETEQGGSRKIDVRLVAVPIQLALSMNPGNFEIGAGIGAYFLESVIGNQTANQSGFSVVGKGFEFGISTWCAYTFPLTTRIRVGPEIMFHILSNRGAAGIVGAIHVSYDIYRY